jgi:hypothetical protein
MHEEKAGTLITPGFGTLDLLMSIEKTAKFPTHNEL